MEQSHMRLAMDREESAEERRLWADFYEATARVVELIRRKRTTGEVVVEIVSEHDIASRALERIKEIRGIS